MGKEYTSFEAFKQNRKIKEELDAIELRKTELDAQSDYIKQSKIEEMNGGIHEEGYFEFLMEHINEAASAKDMKRINDIATKAGDSESKAVALANTMAKLIKNKQKATQRFEAALEVFGKDHPVTLVFAARTNELGGDIDVEQESEANEKLDTNGKLGSQDSTLKKSGREASKLYRSSWGGTPILPLGSVNLATGKCKYFNIYETWGKGNDTTIELWLDYNEARGGKRKHRLVFTSGNGPIAKIGTCNDFSHDQNDRHLFGGELIDWCNIGDASLLMREYKIKSASGYVYK